MTRRTIRNYVLFSSLLTTSYSFSFATYVLFLASLGLDLFQLSLVNFLFMTTVFCFEVPTGAFADVFGRKRSVVLGGLVTAVGFGCYFLAVGFWTSVLAEFVIAIGQTLVSGALNAWVTDQLKFHNHAADELIYQRREQIDKFGRIIGSLGGGYLGVFGLKWPWLAGAIGCLLAAVYGAVTIREDYFNHQKHKSFKEVIATAKEGMSYGLKHRGIMYAVAFSVLLAFIVQSPNMQWSLFFKEQHGFTTPMLGWLMTAITVSLLIGNSLSVRLAGWIGDDKKALVLPQLITVAGILAATAGTDLFPVLSGFLVHEIGRGTFDPVREAYVNRRISDQSRRATILSFQSMMSKLGATAGLLIGGYIAKTHSISVAWYVSALVLALGIPLFLRLKNGEEPAAAPVTEAEE